MNNESIQSENNVALEQLVEKAVSGDEVALNALIAHPEMNQILEELSAWAERMYEQDREDIKQNLLIISYKNIHSLRDTSNFKSWLFKIARNYCLNTIRRDKREKLFSDEVSDQNRADKKLDGEPLAQFKSELTPEQELLIKEKETLFEKQVRKATEPFSPEIVERWANGQSPKQIAEETGRPLKSVYRVLKNMQDAIIRESLSEIDAMRSRMQDSQSEIERQKELTREALEKIRVA